MPKTQEANVKMRALSAQSIHNKQVQLEPVFANSFWGFVFFPARLCVVKIMKTKLNLNS